jgi:hypothetical protein
MNGIVSVIIPLKTIQEWVLNIKSDPLWQANQAIIRTIESMEKYIKDKEGI